MKLYYVFNQEHCRGVGYIYFIIIINNNYYNIHIIMNEAEWNAGPLSLANGAS